ncbi:MAG: YceI family protein [Balneolaceae bacterium]
MILVFLLFASAGLMAQSFMTEEGEALFESSAPFLTFQGTSKHLTGLIDLEENLVDFYLDLNTLETGINRRDRDMRTQYLETDQWPFAEFTGSLESLFDPDISEPQPVTAEGTFHLHGVEREISVEGTITPLENGNLKLEASWSVMLEDYEIERPGILFYELAEEQKIRIRAEMHQQN